MARSRVRQLRPSREARERVHRCKAWFLQLEPASWERLLIRSQLTEDQLEQLSCLDLTLNPAAFPSWVETLTRVIAYLSNKPCGTLMEFAAVEAKAQLPEEQLRLFSQSAWVSWRNALALRLSRSARDVFEWEGQSDQDPPLGSETLRILATYPALARLWAQQVSYWLSFTHQLLQATETLLRHLALFDCAGEQIIQVQPDLSDFHNGNRAVARVTLRSGNVWYFKPRSGAQELGWFKLLGWLNRQGFPYPFREAEGLSFEQNFWMKEIEPRPCRTRAEVTHYFYRAGAILYLAQRLQAADLHAGNLIAHGDQPVIVDGESLRHPLTKVPEAVRARPATILATGLLPVEGSRSHESLSAFGRSAPGAHQASWGIRPVPARDFTDELEAGYRLMHSFLTETAGVGLSFARKVEEYLPDRSRCILRPSSRYADILQRSQVARTMMHGFDRSLFLHAACGDGSVGAEVEALEDGDIPIFHGRAASLLEPLHLEGINESARQLRAAFELDERG